MISLKGAPTKVISYRSKDPATDRQYQHTVMINHSVCSPPSPYPQTTFFGEEIDTERPLAVVPLVNLSLRLIGGWIFYFYSHYGLSTH